MPVIKPSNLDVSKVTFSATKIDVHNRKMSFLNHDGTGIMIQTPKMYAPNGIKRWSKPDPNNPSTKDDKFEIELQFSGLDRDDSHSKEVQEFHQKMQDLDELIKTEVLKNAGDWLGKPNLSKVVLEEAYYKPIVRVSKDMKTGETGKYPPRIRAKIDRDFPKDGGEATGRFLSNKRYRTEVFLYNENKERIELNESNAEEAVPKGSQVVCILELVYLSISPAAVSIKWKLVQAKVYPNHQAITGNIFIDDEEVHQQQHQEDLDTDNSKHVEAGHSDDEENVEDVEEETDDEQAAPAPEPVKPEPVKPKARAKRTVA